MATGEFKFFFDGPSAHPNANLCRATNGSAGYDVYAKDLDGPPIASPSLSSEGGAPELVDTGLHLEIPHGWVGLLKTRSSLAKRGIAVMGGVIDADYRGPVGVVLRVPSKDDPVDRKKAIAQLVVVPHWTLAATRVERLENLADTARGSGGFGSTDRCR